MTPFRICICHLELITTGLPNTFMNHSAPVLLAYIINAVCRACFMKQCLWSFSIGLSYLRSTCVFFVLLLLFFFVTFAVYSSLIQFTFDYDLLLNICYALIILQRSKSTLILSQYFQTIQANVYLFLLMRLVLVYDLSRSIKKTLNSCRTSQQIYPIISSGIA